MTVNEFFKLGRLSMTIQLCLSGVIFLLSASSSAQVFRAFCQQNGGSVTCIKAEIGEYNVYGSIHEGKGDSPEAARNEYLINFNKYVAKRTPPGQIPWVDMPSGPCQVPLQYAYHFLSLCPVGPTYNGNFVGGAGISYVHVRAKTICPANWFFYGSQAPNWQSLPGSCYSTNVKNLPADICPNCGPAPVPFGNPIEATIFNKYQQDLDYSAAVAPLPIAIKRYYSSMGAPSTVKIGRDWKIGFDKNIVLDSSGHVSVFRHTGRVYGFKPVGGVYVGDADINSTLTTRVDAAGQLIGWLFKTPLDDIETYDLQGRLVAITNRAGIAQTLTYDADGRLDKVIDPYGRSLQFAYDVGGRVSTIALSSGEIFQYAYDSDENLVSVTYPDQRVKTYVYGELANTTNVARPNALTGIIDENNLRHATYKYDAQYRATSTENAGGVNKYVLSGGDNIVAIVNPAGASLQRNFLITSDGARRTGSEIQPCATPSCTGTVSSALTYDTNGNRTSRTDFKGNKTCFAYDLTRNLETVRVEGLASAATCTTALVATTFTSPARKTTTTWHASFRLPVTITEPVTGGSRVTTNTYDINGNLTQRQVSTPSGTRTSNWTYDALGRVLTATDALGRTSVNTFYPNTAVQNLVLANSRGMLASSTNALGHTVSITGYNPHGQPLSITDANGLVTNMTYNVRQRLISRTVGVETTTYDYDGVGQLIKVTLPDNSFLTYIYDGAHRLTQIQDGLGNKMVYTLDNMGNRIAESAVDAFGALARTRTRVYDALNRLQKDIGGATPASQISQYAYDANDNQTTMTDPLARVTTNAYDALNRLVQVTDPNTPAGLTKYEYDAQDNLTKVIDPKNLATTYSYNGFNELVSQVSPDTGTTTFIYDSAGNMLTKTDARGVTVTTSYDNLNRVAAISNPAVGSVPAQTITFTYDGAPVSCTNGIGRLCSFTDRTGTTTYRYDQNGRITGKTQSINGLSQSVAYRYNAVGQMDEMALPSGKKVAISYNNNRITGLTVDGQPIVKTADYEPFGPIGEWTWGNDSVTSPNKHTRYFDLDGRNTKIESGAGVGSNAIDPAIIVYDAASRITALQRLTSNVVDPAKSTTYGYDNLDRLTTVTPNAGNPSNPQSYSYDAIGNRLSNTVAGSTTTYSYGTTSHRLNNLTGSTAKTFGYDNVGNRITDGIQTWIYGGDNRPSAISLAGATPVSIQSGINALGQRVLKTVNSAAQGTITRFMYDEAGRLIGEYDISGRPIQETIWLNDLPVAVLK